MKFLPEKDAIYKQFCFLYWLLSCAGFIMFKQYYIFIKTKKNIYNTIDFLCLL